MSTDKQTNVGQELVERLQNLNEMLESIRSAQFDELFLPEIAEKNKPTVKPKSCHKGKKNELESQNNPTYRTKNPYG